MGYSLAIMLSGLMSAKSQPIVTCASDYAYRREVCGDHRHSDIEAGHEVGKTTGIMLLNSSALRPRMEAAKAESKAARQTMQ